MIDSVLLLVALVWSSRRPVRADKQRLFLELGQNSIVNIKEVSNDLLEALSFFVNLDKNLPE